jgi:hypothetical protein
MPQLSLQQYSPGPQTWSRTLTAWLLWGAIFIGADLPKSYAEAATLVAAVLPRTTCHLIARLAEAKILRAGNVVWNADATALWATGRTFDTENCRAWILVDRTANSRAVRPARGWIAAVTRIVNALEASGQGRPANPPHMPPGVASCAEARRPTANMTTPPAKAPNSPRRERELESVFVQRSNRMLSTINPQILRFLSTRGPSLSTREPR